MRELTDKEKIMILTYRVQSDKVRRAFDTLLDIQPESVPLVLCAEKGFKETDA